MQLKTLYVICTGTFLTTAVVAIDRAAHFQQQYVDSSKRLIDANINQEVLLRDKDEDISRLQQIATKRDRQIEMMELSITCLLEDAPPLRLHKRSGILDRAIQSRLGNETEYDDAELLPIPPREVRSNDQPLPGVIINVSEEMIMKKLAVFVLERLEEDLSKKKSQLSKPMFEEASSRLEKLRMIVNQ